MTSGLHQRLAQRLQDLHSNGLHRSPRIVNSLPGGMCVIDDKELVNFGGNDYLSLAHEVCLVDSVQAVFAAQTGATASAVLAGRSEWHSRLEQQLAEFEDTAAALVFPTGFAANTGVLSSLIEPTDAVFCDRDNHASIVDATRSSDGQFYVYRKDRLESLEESIVRRREKFQQVFIVTDGVFSMDGSIASLGELCRIADRNDCHVIVDEAHGTGILGDFGRGACDFTNVEKKVLVRIGTMSKAMGGLGGFVVGDRQTIDWLRNSARSQFYSTALPPGICAAMIESVRIMRDEPARRHRLAELTALAHQAIADLNLQTVGGGLAPIIPVVVGDDEKVMRVSGSLQQQGWFVPAIRPPTVASGTARLRLSMSVSHTNEQVIQVLKAVAALMK